jgi:sodium/hydrogen antiporter
VARLRLFTRRANVRPREIAEAREADGPEACTVFDVPAIFDPQVTFLGWMALFGIVLLAMALLASHLRRLPVSSSLIYLFLGLGIGPLGFGWLRLDFAQHSVWLEHVTEIAVIVSLFIGGLKLRLPFRHPAWRAVYRLAAPVMLLSIVGIALFAHLVLKLSAPAALLLGAVLAPTDPVLASAVSVSEAQDEDRMRYGLSGEAGLNDGMAFPFVALALTWQLERGPGAWLGTWALSRVLWAVPAALALGYVMGKYVSQAAMRHRSRERHVEANSDFLALALIALSYVAAELVHAWGFLAVFGAGVGLRAAELTIVAQSPHPEAPADCASPEAHPPAEDLIPGKLHESAMEQPAVAAGVMVAESLSFGNTAERMLELLLVLVVGVSLASYWDARALTVAFLLFVVLRPVCVRLLLIGTPTSAAQRWLMGWFGVRGVGSLYYLTYSMNEPAGEGLAREIVGITLSVVALSVLVHGVSARPLLARYERSLIEDEPTRPAANETARGPREERPPVRGDLEDRPEPPLSQT